MRTFTRPWAFLIACVFVGGSALGGCSSSNKGQCNTDPFSCPTGQTCWISDISGDYACLNSGPGRTGDACQDTPGEPTCGDGLDCLQTSTTGGTCVAYCDPTDPAHACSGGVTCEPAAIIGTANVIYICHASSSGDTPPLSDSGGKID